MTWLESKKEKMENILLRWTKGVETLLIWGALALLVQGVGAVIAVIAAFPAMLLWNLVIPEIFALPTIDFFQASSLVLLFSMLFNSTSSFLLLGLYLNETSA